MNSDRDNELVEAGQEIMRHWRAGDVDNAIKLANAANELAKRYFGEQDDRYAGAVSTLARIYYEAGLIRCAEAEMLDYADLNFNKYGMMSHDYADALHRLSIILSQTPERAADARNLSNAAKAIMESVLSGQQNEALQGRLKGLHRNLQRGRAQTHHQIGIGAWNEGDFREAESRYRRSLASHSQVDGVDALNYVQTQSALAAVLSQMGKFVESDLLGQQAHEKFVELLGHDDIRVATSLLDRAKNKTHMGQAETAIQLYEEVMRICSSVTDQTILTELKDAEESALRGIVNVILAFEFLTTNRAVAIQRAGEILAQLDPLVRRHGIKSLQFAIYLSDVARYHGNVGALGSAYAFLEASTKIFQELGPAAREQYYTNLLNLADLALSAGYPSQARAYLEESLAWHRHLLGNEHEEVAKCLVGLLSVAAFEQRSEDFVTLVGELKQVDDAILTKQLPFLSEPDAIRASSQVWLRTEQVLLGANLLGLQEQQGLSAVYELLTTRRGIVSEMLADRARRRIGREAGGSVSQAEALDVLVTLRHLLGEHAAVVEYVRIATSRFGPRRKLGSGELKRFDLKALAERTPIGQYDYASSVEIDVE